MIVQIQELLSQPPLPLNNNSDPCGSPTGHFKTKAATTESPKYGNQEITNDIICVVLLYKSL